jgi:hypothetical protein
MLRGAATVATLGLLLALPLPAYASNTEKLAHRGPSTFAVGLAFTIGAPFKLVWDAATGGRPKLQACRFGHGVKMLVGGALLLPAGLLVSPFEAEGLPDAWMDGIVEAYQEDYCLRPIGTMYP